MGCLAVFSAGSGDAVRVRFGFLALGAAPLVWRPLGSWDFLVRRSMRSSADGEDSASPPLPCRPPPRCTLHYQHCHGLSTFPRMWSPFGTGENIYWNSCEARETQTVRSVEVTRISYAEMIQSEIQAYLRWPVLVVIQRDPPRPPRVQRVPVRLMSHPSTTFLSMCFESTRVGSLGPLYNHMG